MELNNFFFVIVLYKNSLEESRTIETLNTALSESINILVFDNSPERQYKESSFIYGKFKIQYYHDANNPGLSFAYNYALNQANENNSSWLLLLDQDTTITKEYIETIRILDSEKMSCNTVAILPKVKSSRGQRLISPSKMYFGGICRPIEISSNLINTPIDGINSGTILRTSYLNEINGFSNKYSLDMLDHWYYRKIFKDSKSVYVMNCTIFQDLSVSGVFENNVTLNRYEQMLLAEEHFIKDDGFLSLLVFKIRLLLRSVKQFSYKNKSYYKLTLKRFI